MDSELEGSLGGTDETVNSIEPNQEGKIKTFTTVQNSGSASRALH